MGSSGTNVIHFSSVKKLQDLISPNLLGSGVDHAACIGPMRRGLPEAAGGYDRRVQTTTGKEGGGGSSSPADPI